MSIHVSKEIIGTKSKALKDRSIVLCISGSVAAVKSPEIARELMRNGAEVYVAMSRSAQQIIHPDLMEWATGNPVVTQLTGKIEHVTLAGEHNRQVDLILIAPSTANTISKIACGIDDTVVTTIVSTSIGSGIPVIIVPAMHESLYKHPIVAENIKKLKSIGIDFVEPTIKEGKAKIAGTEETVNAVINKLTKKDFSGTKVIVTAGATIEHIDPVRVLTNRSSGKMGVAIAEEALKRGAEVTLIYGSGTATPPRGANVIRVDSANLMKDALFAELKSTKKTILIAAAAVCDWTPEKPFDHKVSTHNTAALNIKLKPTSKIIDTVKMNVHETFVVAFRAEYGLSTDELIESAYTRLKEANANLIVANDVSKKGVGFEVDTNEVYIIDPAKNITHIALTSKKEIAAKLLDVIIEKILLL